MKRKTNKSIKLPRKNNIPWWINSKTGKKKDYKNMTRKQKRLNKKWQKKYNKKSHPNYRLMKLQIERRLREKETGNTGWNNTYFSDF